MFTNQVACTVYERTVGTDRMESYIRHVIPAVYWENKQGQFTVDKSMKQSDYILCIIPSSSLSDYLPKLNDLLVCGDCDSAEPPETGSYIVMDVKNFCYGSPNVRHINASQHVGNI
ncbi:MAG: hypothetical protein K2G25_03885 [Oscillospiraceae bacterium]|nr:hypothetical protein [Oscillospiraceae bacterium]